MVGVANPMLRHDRRAGLRFLGGYAAGVLASSLVLGLVLRAGGTALAAHVGAGARTAAAIAVLFVLGVLDALGRTPQARRQVPQRFVRVLPPAFLGIVFGVDIGLVLTTRRTSSLVSGAVVGVALVAPAWVLPAMVAIGLTTALVAVVPAFAMDAPRLVAGVMRPVGAVRLRTLSAVLLVTAAALFAAGVVGA
ncbi:MAG TPA: hypothetical protein VF101_04760 [Gaiellaceae bacterium]